MTNIEALNLTAEFWDAMADEGCSKKSECSKFELVNELENCCPLCEYTPDDCEDCLLADFWRRESRVMDIDDIQCGDSVFLYWQDAESIVLRKKYARMIADAAREKLDENTNGL